MDNDKLYENEKKFWFQGKMLIYSFIIIGNQYYPSNYLFDDI